MTKQIKKKKINPIETNENQGGWVSPGAGFKMIAVLSGVLAFFVAWQIVPGYGWWEGIKYGLIFGAGIWGVYFIMRLFFRIMK